jgi:DNA-binding transcriptional MerR regulator
VLAVRKIGELAQRTGLTVRTLHHYDEIGLLSAQRAEGGHRVYDDAAVQRLDRGADHA